MATRAQLSERQRQLLSRLRAKDDLIRKGYVSVAEAARVLNVSRRRILELCHAGRLESEMAGGLRWIANIGDFEYLGHGKLSRSQQNDIENAKRHRIPLPRWAKWQDTRVKGRCAWCGAVVGTVRISVDNWRRLPMKHYVHDPETRKGRRCPGCEMPAVEWGS